MRKIIIGAIILSIIGAGFFLTRQEVKEIVEDGTDSWKTYRSEEYGFEARYPEDWIVKEDTFANEINFGEEKMKLFKVGFTVAFYQNQSELWGNETKSLSLEDWISKTFLPLKEGEVKKFSTFGVGNYEGFLVKKFKSVGVAKLTTRIFIQRNGAIYEIRSEIPSMTTINFSTKYDYHQTFSQILSTFKFLN